MNPTARYALKEWALQVDALLAGKQVLLLRKGGIFEKQGEFEVEHRDFFLFPTLYHEKAGEIVAGARAGLADLEKRLVPDATLRLPGLCTVEATQWVDSLDSLQGLEGLHPLAPSAVEYRYNYGKARGLHVLMLRAYRLPQPHALPMEKAYDGCVSWVDLGHDLATAGASPAIADAAFAERIAAVRTRLGA